MSKGKTLYGAILAASLVCGPGAAFAQTTRAPPATAEASSRGPPAAAADIPPIPKPNTTPAFSREGLEREITKETLLDGIQVLTGNPDNDEYAKALLQGFNAVAKRAWLKTPPILFLYVWAYGDMAQPDAYSNRLSNGTYIVGISTAMTNLLRYHSPDMDTLIERLIAMVGHENGHILNGDNRYHKRRSPHAKINMELKADRRGLEATCNAKAAIEANDILAQENARENEMSVAEYYTARSADPNLDHPIYQTRVANLEYIGQHLPKSCKTVAKTPGLQ